MGIRIRPNKYAFEILLNNLLSGYFDFKIWKSEGKIKFWHWFVPNWVSFIFGGKICSNNTQRDFLQIFIWNLKSETIVMSNKKMFTRKIRSFFSFFHFNFIQRKKQFRRNYSNFYSIYVGGLREKKKFITFELWKKIL